MKCSVCAQDVPADRYANHLESEHGVTDDPTAVLIQHLTGLRATGGEQPRAADEDDVIEEDEDVDELPEDEPSDADAFEQFLAAHPPPPAEPDEDEDATTEAPAATTEDEEAPTQEAAPAEEAAPV